VDTLVGLAARADLPEAVAALYGLKGRSEAKPLALAFRDFGQLSEWLEPSGELLGRLRFWLPGPVTAVVPGSPRLGACRPEWGLSVGLRLPGPCPASALLERLPWPLALTSANLSGGPDARSTAEVDAGLRAAVGAVLPGEAPLGAGSTILDLRERPARVLRLGALAGPELAARLAREQD
jgi:L-threonylcarbamoyladenylate synthase